MFHVRLLNSYHIYSMEGVYRIDFFANTSNIITCDRNTQSKCLYPTKFVKGISKKNP